MWRTVGQWKHPNRYMDKCPRKDTPCGYCHCERHRGFLNVKLMKKHKCIEKKCTFFEKYETHEYWKAIARKKELKEERKKSKNKI